MSIYKVIEIIRGEHASQDFVSDRTSPKYSVQELETIIAQVWAEATFAEGMRIAEVMRSRSLPADGCKGCALLADEITERVVVGE